jgi:DNA-binding NarL/FixJ family response regulator
MLTASDDRVCAVVITSRGDAPRVLAIASDRRLSVAALAALLLNDPDRSVVQAARGADEVRDVLGRHRPDLVIADGVWSDWPGAISAASWGGRTLALLDTEDTSESFISAVQARAQGYLARTASAVALETAINSVLSSGYYLDPLLAAKILWASDQARALPLPAPEPELSPREVDILSRIAVGQSSKQIAREYAITAKTVCNHVSNIYAKLHFRHRGELVLYAAQHGLAGP